MNDQIRREASRRTSLRAAALAGAGATLGGFPLRSAFAASSAASADAGAPFTPANAFFDAHHAPIGAYATFTLGYPGANGGFGQQQKLPGTQSTYIGVMKDGQAIGLPFYNTSTEPALTSYAESEITRDFRVASDRFTTPDFTFTLFSPVRSIPDPTGETTKREISPLLQGGKLLNISTAGKHSIEDVLLPAIFAEMVIDNSTDSAEITAVFAVGGGAASILQAGSAAVSFGTAPSQTAIATEHANAQPFITTSLSAAAAGQFGPGTVGGIAVTVAPGDIDPLAARAGCDLRFTASPVISPAVPVQDQGTITLGSATACASQLSLAIRCPGLAGAVGGWSSARPAGGFPHRRRITRASARVRSIVANLVPSFRPSCAQRRELRARPFLEHCGRESRAFPETRKKSSTRAKLICFSLCAV